MQYGNPIDKRNVLNLVETENRGFNAKWNEMLELNRMAFPHLAQELRKSVHRGKPAPHQKERAPY